MLFISEIGLNYNAKLSNCRKLIAKAKYSGADIAKFQLGWKGEPGEINHLNKKSLEKLYLFAAENEIEIMFSVFNEKALDLLLNFKVKRIKIASRTLIDNLKLCENIVSLGYETFISLGMWKDKSNLPFSQKNVKYLWCKSLYPTKNEDLKEFPKLFDDQNKFYGYSDHSLGIETCLLAIARGAKIIEKHFTLDKNSNFIRDHQLSAEPEEMKTLVNIGREINKKLNEGI